MMDIKFNGEEIINQFSKEYMDKELEKLRLIRKHRDEFGTLLKTVDLNGNIIKEERIYFDKNNSITKD